MEIPPESEAGPEKDYEKLDGLHQYKGFFYTICPECGNIRGFCSKKEIEGFHCFKCGADIPFTEELGKDIHRHTGMVFFRRGAEDVPCLLGVWV